MKQVMITAVFSILCSLIGCTQREAAPQLQKEAMSLDAAAKKLTEISGAPLRLFSTRDFGREHFTAARSVIVPKNRSRQVLKEVRAELGPKFVVFIGTTRRLGDENHQETEEIVLANGNTQFDALRIAASDAVNYDMDTDDLIKKLTEYDQKYGIDIFHAETDTIEFRFVKLPPDLTGFCKDLYKFCPDIVDQGIGSVAGLESEIRKTQEVFLWWD